MKYVVTMNGKKYEVEVERMSAFHMLTREEIASGVQTPVQPVAAPVQEAPVEKAPVKAAPAAQPAPERVQETKAAPKAGETTVTSPMPGTVLGVKVNVGDSVSTGQTMFVIEAMKMENEIVAPVDGTVTAVSVKAGDTVDTDQIMGILK